MLGLMDNQIATSTNLKFKSSSWTELANIQFCRSEKWINEQRTVKSPQTNFEHEFINKLINNK